MILHRNHHLTELLVCLEHICMLHARRMLVLSTLSRHFHNFRIKIAIRSVIHQCTICHCYSAQPSLQMLGQLPSECVTPGAVFQKVGVDYTGPLQVKYEITRKPVIMKAYICLFVLLVVKAVHLEVV